MSDFIRDALGGGKYGVMAVHLAFIRVVVVNVPGAADWAQIPSTMHSEWGPGGTAPNAGYTRELFDGGKYGIRHFDSGRYYYQKRRATSTVLGRRRIVAWVWTGGPVEGTFELGLKAGLDFAVQQPPLCTFTFGEKVGFWFDIAPQVVGTFELGHKVGLEFAPTVLGTFSFGVALGLDFIGQLLPGVRMEFGARVGLGWSPQLGTPETCLVGDGELPEAEVGLRNYVF